MRKAVRDRALFWLIACVIAGMLLVPFAMTEIPPVLDYPNHLARCYFLALGQSDPILSRMLAAHWGILPDVAIDLILPPLIRVLPVYLAGRIVLAGALLLPLIGGMIYSRALFRRPCYWSLAGALVAFNLGFLAGLMNFLYGLGGAFIAAAIWQRWRESHPLRTVLATMASAVVVFFCHILALGLLGVLVAAYELDRFADPAHRTGLVRRAAAALCVFAPSALLYFLSPTAAHGGPLEWRSIGGKLALLRVPFMNYNRLADAVLSVALLAFVTVAIQRRWLQVPRRTVIAAAMLLVLFLAAPNYLKGAALIDLRPLIMLTYLLFVGVAEAPAMGRDKLRIAVLCLLAIVAIRAGMLGSVWSQQTAIVAQMRRTIAPILPGSRVLVARVNPAAAPEYWRRADAVQLIGGSIHSEVHLPALVLLERRSLWPNLFADPSQQPVTVRPAFRAVVAPSPLATAPFDQELASDDPSPTTRANLPYLVNWRSRFDYVLVMQAGGMPDPAHFLPGRLSLLALTDIAALYKITPPTGTARPR
jgi:hypothetical protein